MFSHFYSFVAFADRLCLFDCLSISLSAYYLTLLFTSSCTIISISLVLVKNPSGEVKSHSSKSFNLLHLSFAYFLIYTCILLVSSYIFIDRSTYPLHFYNTISFISSTVRLSVEAPVLMFLSLVNMFVFVHVFEFMSLCLSVSVLHFSWEWLSRTMGSIFELSI